MLYLKHNFYNNFKNSSGVLRNDLLSDEFAKLIVFDSIAVKGDLIGIGVNLPLNASTKVVKKAILRNLKNKKLRDNLALLIIKNNNKEQKSDPIIKKKISEQISFCADGLNKVESHEKNKTDMENKPIATKKIILITSLITSALWVGGYFLIRYYAGRSNRTDYMPPAPDPNIIIPNADGTFSL